MDELYDAAYEVMVQAILAAKHQTGGPAREAYVKHLSLAAALALTARPPDYRMPGRHIAAVARHLPEEWRAYYETPGQMREALRELVAGGLLVRLKPDPQTQMPQADQAPYLVDFLYHLLRDELPAGAVERLALQATTQTPPETVYTNKELEAFARRLATALLEPHPPEGK